MFDRYRKSDAEKAINAKLTTSAKGLTAKQTVALQCKASDAKNKRRGK